MPVYYNEFKDGLAKYYQSKNTGQVIGVVDNFAKLMYFHFKSTNIHKELFFVNCNLEEDGYSEIVPPKTGDIILLKSNNINLFSPHAGHQFKVKETQQFRIVLTNLATDENLVVDIRNWVWENITPKEKVIPDIQSGDIIEKDGKKYKIILEEYIPPAKYAVGTVIRDGECVIVNTSYSGTNRYYTVYIKDEDEIFMYRESQVDEIVANTFKDEE